MQVVELADARDPGAAPSPRRSRGELEVRVRLERAGQRVHVLAPGPERPAAALRAPAQRAVERVRVRVGEPGQRDAAQVRRVRAGARRAGRRDDPPAPTSMTHVAGEPAAARHGAEPRAWSALIAASVARSRHRHADAALRRDLLGEVVAGVDVADDAHAGVVGQHPRELLRGERGAVGDARPGRRGSSGRCRRRRRGGSTPRRRRSGVDQRVEQRPVGDRVGAVEHRLGLAVGRGDRAAVEVVAADDDRRATARRAPPAR